jgi:adenylate kinase
VRVIVLLGAPGSGKGTQAPALARHLGLPHVATGDLFRAAVRDGSPVGLEARRYMDRGQLVPDDITIRMLLDRLAQRDAAKGVVLDGFPRNRAQAETLDQVLREQGGQVELAVEIDVPAEELVHRLSGRWVCRDNGHVYNEASNPPRSTGKCDLDGSPLIQREDDKAETIRNRMAVTLTSLRDVGAHYKATGVLRLINGLQPIDRVTAELLGLFPDDGAEAADPEAPSASDARA